MDEQSLNFEEFVEKYVKKKNPGYHIFRLIMIPLAHLVYKVKIFGKENIPEKGGVILAINHIHMPDPVFVLISTRRLIRYLAKKELLDSPLGFIYRMMACIPVNREGTSHNAITAAEYALDQGEVIGIFPEGTRNRTRPDDLLPFRYGAVSMASKTGAKIVPVVLKSNGRPFIDDYRVYIGKAYQIKEDADLDKENEILREKMLQLMKSDSQ
ncbi:MAG: 1-acyl-sn-glycerol-3-phosphate acyltransferase [Erysipelotrichaceae bacterium]|nr:1-acyl-sn-glycerol-3-phosphate acyltransferase [Erysipelotrichaceae bacterium]